MNTSLAGAVPYGLCDQDFKKNNPKDIHQHVGIYVFHGISTLPQLEMKFNIKHVDKVHVNYFIYNCFGPNANLLHNNSKALFACQKKLIKPPHKTPY